MTSWRSFILLCWMGRFSYSQSVEFNYRKTSLPQCLVGVMSTTTKQFLRPSSIICATWCSQMELSCAGFSYNDQYCFNYENQAEFTSISTCEDFNQDFYKKIFVNNLDDFLAINNMFMITGGVYTFDDAITGCIRKGKILAELTGGKALNKLRSLIPDKTFLVGGLCSVSTDMGLQSCSWVTSNKPVNLSFLAPGELRNLQNDVETVTTLTTSGLHLERFDYRSPGYICEENQLKPYL